MIVNLFGVPGAGKSTGAAYIFSELKMRGVNCELITEYAKDKVWEDNKAVFDNQLYMFSKQYYRITRCYDKVSCIITDSPLLLSLIYNKNKTIFKEHFDNLVLHIANSYKTMNYLIDRVKPYNPVGRHQSEDESNKLKLPITKLLESNGIEYTVYSGTKENYHKIADEVYSVIDYNLMPAK